MQAAFQLQKTSDNKNLKRIIETTQLPELERIINLALENNTFDETLAQETIDWLKQMELKTLRSAWVPIVERTILFEKFTNAYKTYGSCTLWKAEELKTTAKIHITRRLLIPNNAIGIINTLAHEVLHGLLPFKERHGYIFQKGATVIHQNIGIEIQKEGNEKINMGPKYEIYCSSCEKILGEAYRKTKVITHPEQYVCPFCGKKICSRALR